MAHNAIILHGMPSKEGYYNPDSTSPSNTGWLPWLQKQLLARGIAAQTPEMLNAWQPDYEIWSQEFERYLVSPDTLLVGHSFGAGFLLQWLSEHPEVSVGHVFLVAPSLGDILTPHLPLPYPALGGFMEFDIDTTLTNRVASLTLLHSDNDSERIATSVQHIRSKLPTLTYREFHNYGHFRGKLDMESDAFPELLNEIISRIST